MFSNKMGESIKMVKVGISSKMLFYAERYIILIEKIASTFINVPSDNFKWAIKRLHVQISKIQSFQPVNWTKTAAEVYSEQ